MRVPFVNTDPITDLRYLVLALPVWWLFGVEQFIYSVILSFVLFKIFYNGKFKVDTIICLLLTFMLAQTLSSVFIESPARLLTFVRSYSAYISVLILYFVVLNRLQDFDDAENLISAIVRVMFVASLVGMIGILGLWVGRVVSGISFFLPDFVLKTGYGSLIAERSIGEYAWFIGIGSYLRVTSFFMYATHFGLALVVTLPLVAYLHKYATGKTKWYYKIVFVILTVNLLFTTARVAILSFLLGWCYLKFWESATHRIRKRFLFIIACCVLVIIVLNIVDVIKVAQLVLYARGGGSVSGRLGVYLATIEGFLDNPIWGWGTERDIPGSQYPAGSHSFYLGILYKHGIIGFASIVAIYVLLLVKTKLPSMNHQVYKTNARYVDFLRYGRWCIIIAIIDGFTDVPDLDATTVFYMWIVFSIMIVHRKKLYQLMRARGAYLKSPKYFPNSNIGSTTCDMASRV